MTAPQTMQQDDRWLLWRFVSRGGKPCKVPFQVDGKAASVTNPDHWATYEEAQAAYSEGGYSGLGFVLGGGWAGVDLDDCIDDDGNLAPWATDIIAELDSYSEVSPSGKGVKVFCRGQVPSGKRKAVQDGQLEVYSAGRYFAVTGDLFEGTPSEVNPSPDPVSRLWHYQFEADKISVDPLEACRRVVGQLPESVEGERGHDAMFHACCEIRRWGLSEEDSLDLVNWYNSNRCHPSWSQAEVRHKWDSAKAAEPEPEPGAAPKSTPLAATFSLDLVSHSAFMDLEYDQDFLVDQCVVSGEYMVIGGPQKTLKTGLLVDMAICLSSGTPFLGHFDIPEPKPVIIVSGESGGAVLQRTARSIQRAYGADPEDRLHWGLRLPNLSLDSHLDALRAEVARTRAALVVIDPAYLSLLVADNADSASNVFKMGALLNGYGLVGKETGCTMGLVHHCKGSLKAGAKPNLSNLSFSGFQEWARQWILLNHRVPYDLRTGTADMTMVVGGSAGHGGEYALNISQGRPADPLVGRAWEVRVADSSPQEAVVRDYAEEVYGVLEVGQPKAKRDICTLAGINNEKTTRALETLLAEGKVEVVAGSWPRYLAVDPLLL